MRFSAAATAALLTILVSSSSWSSSKAFHMNPVVFRSNAMVPPKTSSKMSLIEQDPLSSAEQGNNAGSAPGYRPTQRPVKLFDPTSAVVGTPTAPSPSQQQPTTSSATGNPPGQDQSALASAPVQQQQVPQVEQVQQQQCAPPALTVFDPSNLAKTASSIGETTKRLKRYNGSSETTSSNVSTTQSAPSPKGLASSVAGTSLTSSPSQPATGTTEKRLKLYTKPDATTTPATPTQTQPETTTTSSVSSFAVAQKAQASVEQLQMLKHHQQQHQQAQQQQQEQLLIRQQQKQQQEQEQMMKQQQEQEQHELEAQKLYQQKIQEEQLKLQQQQQQQVEAERQAKLQQEQLLQQQQQQHQQQQQQPQKKVNYFAIASEFDKISVSSWMNDPIFREKLNDSSRYFDLFDHPEAEWSSSEFIRKEHHRRKRERKRIGSSVISGRARDASESETLMVGRTGEKKYVRYNPSSN